MDNKARRAVELAYRDQRNRILSWLRGKTDIDSAEDLLHDAFFRALNNLDALEPIRDVTAWLWRIVANLVIDLWRDRSRRPEQSYVEDFDDIVDAALTGADQRYEDQEILDALAVSIRDLPHEQRMVVEAQCLGSESFRSIAARTGIAPDTLASRKRYALEKIRRDLRHFR